MAQNVDPLTGRRTPTLPAAHPTRVPGGPTQMHWYREGYQQAMRDIANALKDGGEAKAREWIANNTLPR